MSDNGLERVSKEICQVKSLKKLNLRYNNLRMLPVEMARMGGLGELWITGNPQLVSPPVEACADWASIRGFLTLLAGDMAGGAPGQGVENAVNGVAAGEALALAGRAAAGGAALGKTAAQAKSPGSVSPGGGPKARPAGSLITGSPAARGAGGAGLRKTASDPPPSLVVEPAGARVQANLSQQGLLRRAAAASASVQQQQQQGASSSSGSNTSPSSRAAQLAARSRVGPRASAPLPSSSASASASSSSIVSSPVIRDEEELRTVQEVLRQFDREHLMVYLDSSLEVDEGDFATGEEGFVLTDGTRIPPDTSLPRHSSSSSHHHSNNHHNDDDDDDDEGDQPPKIQIPEGIVLVDVPQHFLCPITREIMLQPVVLQDGQSYDLEAIMAWLEHHDTSPMTGKRVKHKVLTPNFTLRSLICEFLDKAKAEAAKRI